MSSQMINVAFISLSGSNAQHNCVFGLVSCLLKDASHVDFYTPPQFQNNFGITDLNFNFIQPTDHPYLWSVAKEYRKKHKVLNYDLTIFIDNNSLKLFPLLKNSVNRTAYFQLEITDRKYCRKINDRLFKLLEIYAVPRVQHVITQDLWRAAYIAGEFRIPIDRLVTIPNSPFDVSKIQQSSFLREKYGISPNQIIVGYIGMIDEYTLPEWLLEQMFLTANIRYFFHTHISNHPYLKKIKSRLEKVAILSTDFLPSNEIGNLYSSIDIGLAIGDYQGLVNKYTTVNQALSGYSYGKINSYLALGKPVLYSPKISFSYLNTSQCGIHLTKEDNLKVAIKTIADNYDNYSLNCKQYFNNNLSIEMAYTHATNQLFYANGK